METNDRRPEPLAELLDLLVDGALADDDRRALLLRLEAAPDGWRRCALAFLEAQSWRSALVAAEPEPAEVEPADRPTRPRPRTRLAAVAMAASLALAAFWAGRSSVGPRPPDRGTDLAELPAAPAGGVSPAPGPLVPGPASPEPAPVDRPPAEGGPAGRPTPPEPDRAIAAIGYVSLPTAEHPEAPVVELPVLFGPGLDDRWLRDQPSFVPEGVRRDWERQGLDVELQRRLVSVQLDEAGRYLTIPVDEVKLREPRRVTY